MGKNNLNALRHWPKFYFKVIYTFIQYFPDYPLKPFYLLMEIYQINHRKYLMSSMLKNNNISPFSFFLLLNSIYTRLSHFFLSKSWIIIDVTIMMVYETLLWFTAIIHLWPWPEIIYKLNFFILEEIATKRP